MFQAKLSELSNRFQSTSSSLQGAYTNVATKLQSKRQVAIDNAKQLFSDNHEHELLPFTEGHRTYPILLCHGVARFDIAIANIVDNNSHEIADKLHYFSGVRTFLRSHGYHVYHSKVSFSASVETRANELYENICQILEKTGSPKINLICHSMGGLDASLFLY
ncbi:hypothetical protein RCL1_007832 [Eukaryota sp. TZLM3-RCL]